MKPWIAGNYLPGIPGSRITLKYALYVFTNTDESIL
jgi:hypothetical protein